MTVFMNMNRGILRALVVSTLGLTGTANAQLFHRLLGAQSDERALHVEPTFDGGQVTTGYVRSAATAMEDVFIARHNPDGTLMWLRAFGSNGRDIGYCVRQTLDGGFIVACETDFAPGLGIGLIRYSATGAVMWARIYPGTAHSDIVVNPLPGVAVRELRDDQGFIVVGHRLAAQGHQRGVVIRTDPLGTPVWMSEYFDANLSSQTRLTLTDVRLATDTAGNQGFDITGTFANVVPGAIRDNDVFFMRLSGAGAVVLANTYTTVPGIIQETGDGLDTFGLPNSGIVIVGRNDFGNSVAASQVLGLNAGAGLVWNVRHRVIESGYGTIRLGPTSEIYYAGRVSTAAGGATFAALDHLLPGGAPLPGMLYQWPTSSTGDGLALVPAANPGVLIAGGVFGTAGYGQTDEYLIRADPMGVTTPNCPEVVVQYPEDRPDVRQLERSMIRVQLEQSTFWQAPRTIAWRDDLDCRPTPPCDPDVNCDGAVNGFDIQATEEAVNGDFTNFCQASADLNGDGAVNAFDIEIEEQRVNGAPC
ncbi:hypothetical protein PHYC_01762 [Phycisphaerales bacterium]|nr:hypothetical protein PHYC_01762 [Phycisphaerales bacterium]